MLVAKIILQAVEDYEVCRDHDVQTFIYSEWFELLAEFSGIDPENARRSLEFGRINKVRLRRGELCLY
jgi:hypothetical protein